MAFVLREDTEKWFSSIKDQPPLETKFDIFYFCLMLGFATGRKSLPGQMSNTTDIVQNFVKSYRPVQRLIVGLLLISELNRLGIGAAEKDAVRRVLLELFNPESQTNLTDVGMNRMNEYASGGYDYLAEQFPDKPHHVEDFLRMYTRLVQSSLDSNPHWKLNQPS